MVFVSLRLERIAKPSTPFAIFLRTGNLQIVTVLLLLVVKPTPAVVSHFRRVRQTRRCRFHLLPFSAAVNMSHPVTSAMRRDKGKRGVRQLPDAALMEKWPDCSLTAGTSLSRYWSRSGCQLHTPYTCSEPGRCRRWNRYTLHRSPLSRSPRHRGRHRHWSRSLPST